jgi:hypothetical protein
MSSGTFEAFAVALGQASMSSEEDILVVNLDIESLLRALSLFELLALSSNREEVVFIYMSIRRLLL